jgi:hypothetical protein
MSFKIICIECYRNSGLSLDEKIKAKSREVGIEKETPACYCCGAKVKERFED